MALCLGTAQLGQNYGIFRKPDKETAFQILEAAVDGGIEYIDTAPVYGESEKIIGTFLKANGVRMKLITKIPKFKGKDSKLFIDHCKRYAVDSMRALGRGQLWAILLHEPQNAKDFPDEILGLKTWFLVMGIAGKFGVSMYQPEDLAHRFLGIYQIPLNIQDTRFIREVPKDDFFWQGNTIMVRSIYLQGKIQEYRKALGFAVKAIGKLTRHNLIVIGCENPTQVLANINMFKNDVPMGETEYNQIMEESRNPDLAKIDPRKWK